ncbi:hypothetical protein [Halpernia sp. GG3]
MSNNSKLIQFIIKGNQIAEIDITKNPNLKMNILYIDGNVKIIGTKEQMGKYSPAPSPPPSM